MGTNGANERAQRPYIGALRIAQTTANAAGGRSITHQFGANGVTRDASLDTTKHTVYTNQAMPVTAVDASPVAISTSANSTGMPENVKETASTTLSAPHTATAVAHRLGRLIFLEPCNDFASGFTVRTSRPDHSRNSLGFASYAIH